MHDSNQTSERRTETFNGWAMLAFVLLASVGLVWVGYSVIAAKHVLGIWLWSAGVLIWCFLPFGFFTLQPNLAAVLILFGAYRGTVTSSGFHWANPFLIKKKVSLRAHNLNGEKLKVNELRGNPIEIAAIVVWRVTDTARAVFDVEDYLSFVSIQCEAALRHLAMSYPYDTFEGDTHSLRGSVDEVSVALKQQVQERVVRAGVLIEETRISHLAYAAEIAGAMLQRQQAEAVIAARSRIVDGAVGMVEMALAKLEQHKTVNMDEERKAAMVSNLLVVLCAHEPARPIVNAGTLYTG